MLALTITSLLSLLPGALSRPIFSLGASTGAPAPVSLDVVNSTPQCPGQFARVAYCSSASITTWTYGAPCNALKNITFLQSGCDEGLVPLYYIAHDADQSLPPRPHDAQFGLMPLNVLRFPETASKNITVHDGFQQTFERMADSLLAGLMDGLKSTMKKIIVTGHSLGACCLSFSYEHPRPADSASVAFFLVIDLDRRGSGDDDRGDDQGRGGSVCGRVHDGLRAAARGNQGWADFLDSQLGLTSSPTKTTPSPPPAQVPRVPALERRDPHRGRLADEPRRVPRAGQRELRTGNNVLAVGVQNHLGPYFNDITFGGSQCSS
ncbi:hypothetical protein B0H13DRAFT_2669423 [Mycena leptocephala]|nr:hypothetical protein B0H13DRAFT_2669423 [Mycena leptocephala]